MCFKLAGLLASPELSLLATVLPAFKPFDDLVLRALIDTKQALLRLFWRIGSLRSRYLILLLVDRRTT